MSRIRRLIKRANPFGQDEDAAKSVYHCPFCASGSVTGGSDGSIECGFCQRVFKVYVQPKHLGAPSTVDGQPYEGGERDETPAPTGESPDAPAGTGIEQFRTASGHYLSREDYIRHLAIAHADDREAVLGQVRADARL